MKTILANVIMVFLLIMLLVFLCKDQYDRATFYGVMAILVHVTWTKLLEDKN